MTSQLAMVVFVTGMGLASSYMRGRREKETRLRKRHRGAHQDKMDDQLEPRYDQRADIHHRIDYIRTREERRSLRDNAVLQLPDVQGPQQYIDVNVFIISWKHPDNLKFTKDAKRLANMFRKDFRYTVRNLWLPSNRDPGRWLHNKVLEIKKDYDRKDELNIFYYGGHGGRHERDQSRGLWLAAKIDGGPTLDWMPIQDEIQRFESDKLIMIDSCYAGEAARSLRASVVELLAATDYQSWAPIGQGIHQSFTEGIVQQMQSMVQSSGAVRVRELHRRLAKCLIKQPFYCLLDGDGSIVLRPHPDSEDETEASEDEIEAPEDEAIGQIPHLPNTDWPHALTYPRSSSRRGDEVPR